MLTGALPSAETTLPVLSAGGFGASVDACAWEPDSDQRQLRLWFLSLLGPQQSLKALWARLIKGEVATLSVETLGRTRFCALAPEGARGWHRLTASLPHAGGHHLVLLPEAARFAADRLEFLLLPQSSTEASALHWRFLNRRSKPSPADSTFLHPLVWQAWSLATWPLPHTLVDRPSDFSTPARVTARQRA